MKDKGESSAQNVYQNKLKMRASVVAGLKREMMNDPFEATHEAEECLLGALLIEGAGGTRQALLETASIVNAGDFHYSINSRIFTAMLSCEGPTHEINVAQEMHRSGTLEPGDCAHLAHCIWVTPCSLDYIDYARAVKYYSEARKGNKGLKIKGAR